MPATREDLVRIARDVVATTHDKHDYFGNPVAFDPHEWVLEAMDRAYRRGRHDELMLHPSEDA
jgi:hypothetical protein